MGADTMLIELKGRVNDQGQVEVEWPADLPVGEIRIVVESINAEAEAADDAQWDAQFAQSQDVLSALAERALRNHDAGLTDELDPDNL